MGCYASKEAELMKSLLFSASKAILCLDGHAAKMRRQFGFKVPQLFQELIGETEGVRVFKKCNKQRLRDVKTASLEQLADSLLKKSQYIASPSIKSPKLLKAYLN